MHVVFTAVPGHGHVNPMVPLARELAGRGHRITFVTGAELAGRVESLGFACVAAGPTIDEMQRTALADPAVRAHLDSEPWRVAAAIFAGRVAGVHDDLGANLLNPDLVVHDAYELAGPLLAARAGVPWVTHGLGPRWPEFLEDAVGDLVAPVWAAHGGDAPGRGGLGHHGYIEICPPEVRSHDSVQTDELIESRPHPMDEPWDAVDPFPTAPGPRVYATFGTFTNANVDAFRMLMRACGGTHASVLLTVGDQVDLHGLEPVPPSVRVERYVPQAIVMDRADLAVCHGGSGTVLAALARGVPVVIVPQGADQFRNAPFWEASGAVRVSPPELDVRAVRDALVDAGDGGPLRVAASAVRDSIATMPSIEHAADRLEAMVA